MELVPESMLTVGGFGGGGDSPVGVVELGRGGGVAGVAGAPPQESATTAARKRSGKRVVGRLIWAPKA